ncbi:hypothetical protein [Rhizobium sp. Leaf386]|uniref:hypothetical protein n=1 Tax=Rhizobium sp. Leaf386 TaxID=1736359 RepID=UPI00071296A8|nr:hypothetical protein [Rhizobium sp. Leaf386]KQT02783.1 hypothetical protein ASG50_18745 [Rhizobium sp. Leaf386]
MASPWKFLARLTSRLRGSKEQQDGLSDDVKSKGAAGPEPVKAAPDKTPNRSYRLVKGEAQPTDQPDAKTVELERSAEADSSIPANIFLESVKVGDAADPVLSESAGFTDTSTHDALTVSHFKKRPSATQKRSQEASVIKPAEVSPQLPTSAPTFADEVQSLDEEIRLLRGQLARKLQLQNAQLKMMLNRFER